MSSSKPSSEWVSQGFQDCACRHCRLLLRVLPVNALYDNSEEMDLILSHLGIFGFVILRRDRIILYFQVFFFLQNSKVYSPFLCCGNGNLFWVKFEKTLNSNNFIKFVFEIWTLLSIQVLKLQWSWLWIKMIMLIVKENDWLYFWKLNWLVFIYV